MSKFNTTDPEVSIQIAPVVFCLVSEIPSSRLRTKTIILARNAYNIFNIVTMVLILYQLNSEKWNWGAKSGFFWGGFCVATLAWAIIDLPETSGRTFPEINELFRQEIPARRFKSAKVDTFILKEPTDDLAEDKALNTGSTSNIGDTNFADANIVELQGFH